MIEYFFDNLWLLWLALALVCLLAELCSGDFFITCFSIGALCALVTSLIVTDVMWLQIVVFAVCSVLSIMLIRPRILHALHPKEMQRESNADAIIGRIGTVSEAIPQDGYGRVKLDGDDWKAQGENGSAIAMGCRVQILSRESIILTVRQR